MNWIAIAEVAYFIVMLLVIMRVIYDTRSGSKTLGYILFIVFVPVIGIIFYFSFGINYRKRKLYTKKLVKDKQLQERVQREIRDYSTTVLRSPLFPDGYDKLAKFIEVSNSSPLTAGNTVRLLTNGEEKFPALLQALASATSHIHLEYYIYEDDKTGNEIADILVEKAQQGITVRFLYDDFGSHKLSKAFINRLRAAGVQTAPFYRVRWFAFANRINYRNHRKIIIIDGHTSFVGGINISDRYRNDLGAEQLYWRDTHLMVQGRATFYLQYLFLCDWNFCTKDEIEFNTKHFHIYSAPDEVSADIVQIVASGPDSTLPVILLSLMEAIGAARNEILITSPYFIPDDSLVNLLMVAARSGVEVKLLVPGVSDSKIVNAAARSYYSELLTEGVQIFHYQKGFVHAKTVVIDNTIAFVGSANMDYRSFDLNFEVNAVVYGGDLAQQLRSQFENDLKHSIQIDPQQWLERPRIAFLWDKFVRLLSPFL